LPRSNTREGYADGEDKIYYGVRNPDNTKWELHRLTTLTYGSPDRLTRNGWDARALTGDVDQKKIGRAHV